MNRYLDRLQQEHRRLNRLIDNCRSVARQSEMMSLKKLRLKIKDRIAQCSAALVPSPPNHAAPGRRVPPIPRAAPFFPTVAPLRGDDEDSSVTQHGRMDCPICSVALVMSDRQGIEIDYCPQCRGVWLDRGELDKIMNVRKAPHPG